MICISGKFIPPLSPPLIYDAGASVTRTALGSAILQACPAQPQDRCRSKTKRHNFEQIPVFIFASLPTLTTPLSVLAQSLEHLSPHSSGVPGPSELVSVYKDGPTFYANELL